MNKPFNPCLVPVTGAKYTETIQGVCYALCQKEIIESGYTLTDDEILELARPKIFDFDYQFYTEDMINEKGYVSKKDLETGILNHFFFDEIGQETYAYWKRELKHWMIINMPRYFSLFKTIPFQDQENPTFNTSYDEEYTRQNTGSSSSSGKDKATNLTSSTPQGRLDLEGTNYVDSIVQQISEPGSKSETDANEDYKFHREGNIGVQTLAEVLQGSRDAIITLETNLYDEMLDYGLFYNIY